MAQKGNVLYALFISGKFFTHLHLAIMKQRSPKLVCLTAKSSFQTNPNQLYDRANAIPVLHRFIYVCLMLKNSTVLLSYNEQCEETLT